MRRQNPPQSYLARAREIETYLRPLTIAAIYATVGVSYAALVCLIFVGLVYGNFLKPTPFAVMVFAVIAFIPATIAFLASFLRPNDPLSLYLTNLAGLWRAPISVSADTCTFTTSLRSGEPFNVKLSFYYPLKDQTASTKERLYSYVRTAITRDCSMRTTLPTLQEIESAIDPHLEMLAEECNLSVIYSETEDISVFHEYQEPEYEYRSTGTWD
jgi:hypothetical protein